MSMLTPSRDISNVRVQLLETDQKQMGEAPWKHYARAMLPLSPVARKSPESAGMNSTCAHAVSEPEKCHNYSENTTFDQDKDLVIDIEPQNCLPCENNSPKRNNRNAMLRRLADCFAYRHRRVKSGARRHRVMGFHPQLHTIHENASELANDLEVNFQTAINPDTEDMDLLENDSDNFDDIDSAFIRHTNDQKIAALHDDIKELWKRLENVEKEFAWARGNLLTRHADVN